MIWVTQDYIKNNFIIDYAASTDYQDHLEKLFYHDYADYADILFTLTTPTTLISTLREK